MPHIPATPAAATVADKAAQLVLQRSNVRLCGSGPATLLFCNGFNCGQNIWHHVVPFLRDQHQLVLFDQMGVGGSDRADCRSPRYETLQGYVQDVLDIAQALDLQQAVLVGHSAGALIALLAAQQAPTRFAKVVLLAATPRYLNAPGYHGGFDRATIDHLLAEMDADYLTWASTFATMMIGQHDALALSHELMDCASQADKMLARRMIAHVFLGDYRSAVPTLEQPTLLVQCADDPAVPEEVNHYLAQHLPRATLCRLSSAGHCPHLTKPSETAAAMNEFIARS